MCDVFVLCVVAAAAAAAVAVVVVVDVAVGAYLYHCVYGVMVTAHN